MSITCIFCKELCVRDTKTASAYNCNNHPHKVSIYTDMTHKHIEWCSFSIVEGHKSYDFSWFYPNDFWPFNTSDVAVANQFSIGVSIEGDELMIGDIILQLPYHPNNFTPENASEKLKVWLALL